MQKYRITLGPKDKTVTGKSVKEEQDKIAVDIEKRILQVFEQSGKTLKISSAVKEQAVESVKSQREGELIAITAICEAYAKGKGKKLSDMIMAADIQSRVSHHDGGVYFDVDMEDIKILREGFEEVSEDHRVQLLHYYDLLKQINSPSEIQVPGGKTEESAESKK